MTIAELKQLREKTIAEAEANVRGIDQVIALLLSAGSQPGPINHPVRPPPAAPSAPSAPEPDAKPRVNRELTGIMAQAMAAMRDLPSPVTPMRISEVIGITKKQAQNVLLRLRKTGSISRLGKDGYAILTEYRARANGPVRVVESGWDEFLAATHQRAEDQG